jgi:RimJ/RimL family protein N-acetyltransferase/ketosteroid isomerase-like protein
MPSSHGRMDVLARRVSAALEAGDLKVFAELLDPHVRWGPPGDPAPPCRSKSDVLAWYQRGRDAGASAAVVETLVAKDRILVGLHVTGRADGAEPAGREDRWQVLTVRDGLIAEIVGFPDRDEAAAWAGIETAPVRTRIRRPRWRPPPRPLADDRVVLRLPELTDAATLHEYAVQPEGLAGSWAPLTAGVSLARCQALVGDWQAGWRGDRSFQGPALVLTRTGHTRLAGIVGIGERGDRVAELSYGVAPEHRGQGLAARAARLVARWLLAEGQADEVELRIEKDNVASQHVAANAGFSPAGTVVSRVPGTGESYVDLRFVLPLS